MNEWISILRALTYQNPQDGARIAAKLPFQEDSARERSDDTLALIRRQQWRDCLIQCSSSQPQPGNQVTQIDMIIPGAQHERKGQLCIGAVQATYVRARYPSEVRIILRPWKASWALERGGRQAERERERNHSSYIDYNLGYYGISVSSRKGNQGLRCTKKKADGTQRMWQRIGRHYSIPSCSESRR